MVVRVRYRTEVRRASTTAYTQFATWATVEYLARHGEARVLEAGEAYRKSVGN